MANTAIRPGGLGMAIFLAIFLQFIGLLLVPASAQGFETLSVLRNDVFTIRYEPRNTTLLCTQKQFNGLCAESPGDAQEGEVPIGYCYCDHQPIVLETKFDGRSEERFLIACEASFDMGFFFHLYREDAAAPVASLDPSQREAGVRGQYIESIQGEELVIPGDGFLYVRESRGNFFKVHRKLKLEQDLENERTVLREVEPAYYYVGMQTKTLKAIQLFSDTELKQRLASLPAGSEVEILVVPTDCLFGRETHFLIKTAFNLVGWYKHPDDEWSLVGIRHMSNIFEGLEAVSV